MSNFVNLVFNGQLVRDPLAVESGAVIKVAVNRAWTNNEGKKVEQATFYTVWLSNGQAENALKYLVKGQNVTVVAASLWPKSNLFNGNLSVELHCNASQVHYGAKPKGESVVEQENVPEVAPAEGDPAPF